MSQIRNLTFILLVALIFSEPSVSSTRFGGYIAAGVIATTGAIMLGMGGMLTKFAQDDDRVIAARYGGTALSVQNYTVTLAQCVTRSGKTSYSHPYTATCQDSYQVQTGNLTETYYVAYGQVCGDSESDALSKVQATYPIGNWWQIYYLYADHSNWLFRVPTSSLWYGAIPLYCVGGIAFLFGAALAGITKCSSNG